jgi:hypothetical protein
VRNDEVDWFFALFALFAFCNQPTIRGHARCAHLRILIVANICSFLTSHMFLPAQCANAQTKSRCMSAVRTTIPSLERTVLGCSRTKGQTKKGRKTLYKNNSQYYNISFFDEYRYFNNEIVHG